MNAELIRRIRAIEEELKKSRTKERTFSRRGFDVTLASDAFSVNHHSLYFLSPETSTTDDLSTINAGADGRLIYLALKNAGNTITVKDGIGNIFLGSDRVLDSQEDVLPLLFNRELDGWVEFSVSVGEHYTDESAQDAVGGILTDTDTIDFTYDNATPQITADVKDDSISNAKLANMAETTIKGRASGAGAGDPTDLSANQVLDIVKTVDGSGSGLDADLLDGIDSTGFALASHTHTALQITDFNEVAQDAVGSILQDTTSIDFTYDDTGNIISAVVLPAGVDHNSLANLNTGDPHTQYVLLAGRSGGQTLIGGTASGNNLTLRSTSNATRGKVVFGNAGATVYDEANERFGIAQASPSHLLHVGTGGASSIFAATTGLIVASQAGLTGLALRNDSDAVEVVAYAATASGNIGTGTNHPIILRTNNVEVVRLTTDGLMGINKTTPDSRLHIVGTNNDTGGIRIESSAGTAALRGSIFGRGNVSFAFKRHVSNGAFQWVDESDALQMTLDSSNQLGLGVASPQGKLHAHDGTGGFGHFTKTGIVGSAQTIIPDGAGDVTKGGTIIGSASTTDGAINVNVSHAILNGANTDITPGGGGDTLRFSVAANGSLTVVRQAGTKTWEISIWVVWR